MFARVCVAVALVAPLLDCFAADNTFTDIQAGLPGVEDCSVAWGDYDNDGDLDIALAGYHYDEAEGAFVPISKVLRNEGAGRFSDIQASLVPVWGCGVAWGDFDNDGDLDLALTGVTASYQRVCAVYRNDAGSFTDINAGLASVAGGALAWADFDNDGDLDLAVSGSTGSEGVTKVYRNDGGGRFTDTHAALAQLTGALAWGDYDADGDLDLALAGLAFVGGTPASRVYRNDGGAVFTDIQAPLVGVSGASLAWADIDADGDLDLAIAGTSLTIGGCARIYRNDGGSFTEINAPLFPLGGSVCSLAWGDYDNDGDPDLALSNVGGQTRVYRNDNGTFADAAAAIDGVLDGCLAWGDFDNDGGLDLLVAGDTGPSIARIYQNDCGGFTGINAGLQPVHSGAIAWGDYDHDGQLDLTLVGGTAWASTSSVCKVYHNDGGAFTDIDAGLPGLLLACLAWGDYDDDGDLDLVIAGDTWTGRPRFLTRIYRNDGGTFTDINAGLPGVDEGSLAWGDYDDDGDLDLALAGQTWDSPYKISKVFRNDDGSFVDIGASLTGVKRCSLAWGDYDHDGDLDLAITGEVSWPDCATTVYRNDGGLFIDAHAGLPGVIWGSLAWADYDGDGDLDLAIAGYQWDSPGFSRIYRNDNGTFTDINANLPDARDCCVAWGDYDRDGDPDLVIAGNSQTGAFTWLYRNEGADRFTPVNIGVPGVHNCSLAWGDYDGDGILDLALVGQGATGTLAEIYHNVRCPRNSPPSPPTALRAVVNGADVTFTWSAATDAQSPAAGLGYNLRVGTRPAADNILCGMADTASGFRRIPAVGNAQQRLAWTLKGLAGRDCYWSVQAVDTAFAGSAWAPERLLSPADVNADGCINVTDLLTVRNCLGKSGSIPADVNGDGLCNVTDLLMVRNRMGQGACQ